MCPRCGAALVESQAALSCSSCPYRAEQAEGILFFDRGIAAERQDHDALYKYETAHPWFTHRLNVIRRAFAKHVGTNEDVLEVGAGTGHTARALVADGYGSLSLGDIHRNGLLYAKQYGLTKLYQFDLSSPPFRDHFDVVALFDVLEHLPDDELAVRNIRAMLRPGGRILLTVPAHRWLWGPVDVISSHRRRYERKGLNSLLVSGGFEVLECRYFFTAMVPGLLLRSLLSRDLSLENVARKSGLELSRLGNVVLTLASGPGDVLLSPLRNVTGGSLLAVARKSREPRRAGNAA